MGSNFGKARKYNIHSMDSSSFKYQTVSEDEMKPSLPVIEKVLFSNHQQSSLRSRLEKNSTKLRANFDEGSLFDPGYPGNTMPEYYNLRVNGELLGTQHIKRSSSNTLSEEGDYITLKEPSSSPPTPPPLPDESIPPPLTPRNKVNLKTSNTFSNKSDTAFNSNPRPNQKVYSAEDIERLLRPLIEEHVNYRRSISSFERVSPDGNHNFSRYQPRHHRCCHHICDCHRIHHEFTSPPPYNFTGSTHDTGQNVLQYPNRLHDSIMYRHNNNLQYHTTASQQEKPSIPYHNYNTMPLDRDLNNHKLIRFNSSSGSIKTNHLKYNGITHTKQTTDSKYSQNSVETQTPLKHTRSKQEKELSMRHKRDPLYQSEVFSQSEFRSDPPVYRSLRLQPCYTIPEEGSWLPPFHYDPAVHHSQRRSYHH